MTRNTKLSVLIGAAVVCAALVAVTIAGSDDDGDGSAAAAGGEAKVLRADSHRLDSSPTDRATLVEFVDFECEGCRALYPYIERLREMYEGELTFVIRYFPNEGHTNAMSSALAVEAAARQGKLDEMYQKMFETQAEWGESSESKADVFAGFARELGLDMKQFQADLADPSTRERVEADRDEGLALGVEGTPTLFLDGEPFPLPESFPRMQEEIDAAIE